jgi:uncharacterized protein
VALYLDTSVVLSLHLNDSKSIAVGKKIRSTREEIAVSAWTATEACSAVAILVRRGTIDADFGQDVLLSLETFFESALLLSVNAAAFGLAKQWLGNFSLGLRAGDALHAAIASVNGAELVTTDKIFARVARTIKLKCIKL